MELKAIFKKQLNIVERKDFRSRKVWVITEDNPQYPQTIEVEVQGDKVSLFDGVSEGSPVTMQINLRGRLWTGSDNIEKCFNSLVCWRVEADKTHVPNVKQPAEVVNVEPLDDGTLPF